MIDSVSIYESGCDALKTTTANTLSVLNHTRTNHKECNQLNKCVVCVCVLCMVCARAGACVRVRCRLFFISLFFQLLLLAVRNADLDWDRATSDVHHAERDDDDSAPAIAVVFNRARVTLVKPVVEVDCCCQKVCLLQRVELFVVHRNLVVVNVGGALHASVPAPFRLSFYNVAQIARARCVDRVHREPGVGAHFQTTAMKARACRM